MCKNEKKYVGAKQALFLMEDGLGSAGWVEIWVSWIPLFNQGKRNIHVSWRSHHEDDFGGGDGKDGWDESLHRCEGEIWRPQGHSIPKRPCNTRAYF